MDIISLGKANKALKDKEVYQSNFLGEGVEAHFSSLDERLDWLENQYGSAQVEATINLLTQDAVMDNVEFVGGNLVLKHEVIDHTAYQKNYVAKGAYKKTYDLTGNLIAVVAQDFLKQVAANQSASIQFEASDDGITFDAPQDWSATVYPEKRFIRVTIILESADTKGIDYVTDVVLEDNLFIKENLLLKSISELMISVPDWIEEGSVHRKKIPRDEHIRFDAVDVLDM